MPSSAVNSSNGFHSNRVRNNPSIQSNKPAVQSRQAIMAKKQGDKLFEKVPSMNKSPKKVTDEPAPGDII